MTGPPSPNEELNTWKEIADYLSISIREAQYREKSDGLPVRRLDGKKPRVWALRSELDAWKLKGATTEAATAPIAPVAQRSLTEVSPLSPNEHLGSTTQWGRRAFLGTAGMAIAAFGARLIVHARTPRVERAVLTGNLLTALDGLGGRIWQYRFAGSLQEPITDDPSWRVQVVDLEGNGSPGVLAIIRRASEQSVHLVSDELYYFTSHGELRWTVPCRPDLLDFDGKQFEPVWWCSHVIAVPSGKGQILWVGVHHGWRWPGCVLSVDAKGRSALRFANHGFVETLCRLTRPNGEFIAVAGENNGFNNSFVAVLSADDPASSSPSGGAARCHFASSPRGEPRDYILFPTTEMLAAMDVPYGRARVTEINDGGFIVNVTAIDSPQAELLYQFSGTTEPSNVMPSTSCQNFHRRLQEEGRLNHTWTACPEIHKPITIRHWRRGKGMSVEQMPWRAVTDYR